MKKVLEEKNTGKIISIFSGVIKIKNLRNVFLHEVLLDQNDNEIALVVGFNDNIVEAILFNENFDNKNKIYRSFRKFSIKISENIIGRVVNGFGKEIDGFNTLKGENFSVFSEAPAVNDRKPVTRPLTTGIKIIDTNLPLGRGQRELIIGDRKLGKSSIAIDTVLNQKNTKEPIYCIYVLIAQKSQKIEEVISLFEKNNSFLYTTIVAVDADSTFAEIYLAPFVGSTIGEYFRDRGKDALVIYDDLSKHAKAYRDFSLLLERNPGREAYPGDIFSLHAKLLEKPAQLSDKKGGGSLTALPIIETQEGDITAFIPTNIISITDGQIYLENDLFQKDFLPAVNIGLSVSRLGSSVQPKILKETVGNIRLLLAQHKELQNLIKLETIKNKKTLQKFHRGELILELLKQDLNTNISWPEQVILFYTVENGFFDDLQKEMWYHFQKIFLELIRNRHFKILERIENGFFNMEEKNKIKEIVSEFKEEFLIENNL